MKSHHPLDTTDVNSTSEHRRTTPTSEEEKVDSKDTTTNNSCGSQQLRRSRRHKACANQSAGNNPNNARHTSFLDEDDDDGDDYLITTLQNHGTNSSIPSTSNSKKRKLRYCTKTEAASTELSTEEVHPLAACVSPPTPLIESVQVHDMIDRSSQIAVSHSECLPWLPMAEAATTTSITTTTTPTSTRSYTTNHQQKYDDIATTNLVHQPFLRRNEASMLETITTPAVPTFTAAPAYANMHNVTELASIGRQSREKTARKKKSTGQQDDRSSPGQQQPKDDMIQQHSTWNTFRPASRSTKMIPISWKFGDAKAFHLSLLLDDDANTPRSLPELQTQHFYNPASIVPPPPFHNQCPPMDEFHSDNHLPQQHQQQQPFVQSAPTITNQTDCLPQHTGRWGAAHGTTTAAKVVTPWSELKVKDDRAKVVDMVPTALAAVHPASHSRHSSSASQRSDASCSGYDDQSLAKFLHNAFADVESTNNDALSKHPVHATMAMTDVEAAMSWGISPLTSYPFWVSRPGDGDDHDHDDDDETDLFVNDPQDILKES